METTNPNQQTNPSENEKLSHTEKLSHMKKLSPKTFKNAQEDKEYREAKTQCLIEAGKEENITFQATATSPESKEEFVIPLRATITAQDKNIDISKTSVWTLMTLNNMTVEEVNQFEKEYKDKLTFSEKLSLKLLRDALRGGKEATKVYWEIQSKVLNRPKILSQLNVITPVEGAGTIMSQLLDDITKNINKDTNEEDAQEGEIVS